MNKRPISGYVSSDEDPPEARRVSVEFAIVGIVLMAATPVILWFAPQSSMGNSIAVATLLIGISTSLVGIGSLVLRWKHTKN